MRNCTVLKLGGELLQQHDDLRRIASALARAARTESLVIVHGGGGEIDAELALRGVTKRAIDGIRLTDDETLGVVVSVLAGRVNTRLVAAMCAEGALAVGLTGADAALGLATRALPYHTHDGQSVDLGLVGELVGTDQPRLLVDLCERGYIPIVASIGMTTCGQLLNVNADTFAAHLASQLGVSRLVIAGTSAGVLDAEGRRLLSIDVEAIPERVAEGSVHHGMVAKLLACREALHRGVEEVWIVDGRNGFDLANRSGTMVTSSAVPQGRSIGVA